MKRAYNMTDAEIDFLLENDIPDALQEELLEEANLRWDCAHDPRFAQAMGRAYGPDNEPS